MAAFVGTLTLTAPDHLDCVTVFHVHVYMHEMQPKEELCDLILLHKS